MSIHRVFIKERSAYTVSGLSAKLGVDEVRTSECISALAVSGVLRWRSGSTRDEFDGEAPAFYAGKYQFVYVGLAFFDNILIIIYPKYMDDSRFIGNSISEATCNDLRQLFCVLRKSSGSYSRIVSFTESTHKFNDRIACMLMLIEMYDEYGIYSNSKRVLKTNGPGEISWERTIAAHQAFIDNGTPIYFDFETITSTRDDADFIMRLHRCVLTECSSYMKETGLAELLSLDEIELSDEKIEELGDKEFILYKLNLERGAQFVTWKQEVFDLLIRYLNEDESDVNTDKILCLGSTAFHDVWEKACKAVFGDLLDKQLDEISSSLSSEWAQRGDEKLIGIVPRPKWARIVNGEGQACGDVKTLIPDTVAVWDYDDRRTFVVLDAKYYTPQLGAKPKGVPGVGDITKQILYQRAYRDFVSSHNFSQVVNAFLVPYEGEAFELLGHVDFPGVFDCEEPPFVDGVDMWLVPAARVWRCYLNGKVLTNDEQALLLDAARDSRKKWGNILRDDDVHASEEA